MRTTAGILIILLGGLVGVQAADPVPPPMDDSFWTRPALLDPPAGPRQFLRDQGISFDAWLTQFYQGIVSGDGDKTWQYGGKGDLIVTFDGGKMGLWPGFFVSVHQEWNYGRDANFLGDGTFFPVNTSMAFPRLGGSDKNTSIVVTQNFGDSVSIAAGKFNLLDIAARTPLAGGGGLDTFMNTAIAAPISGVTPPYLLGTIATLKTQPAIFTLMVYDPRNAQSQEVIEKPFSDGVTTSLSATVPTRIAGLQGFYGVRGVYSTKSGFNLSDVPALILPPESRGTLEKQGYRYVSVSAQQYLYQDPTNPALGWGVFGELAVSDGNPNPFRWHTIVGLAGTPMFPGRALDRWGIAYFKYGLSNDLVNGLDRLGVKVRDEQGLEAFYNIALTPWLRVTADLQWIRPGTAERRDVVLGALRAQVRF